MVSSNEAVSLTTPLAGDRDRFIQFLKRRQLNKEMIELLTRIKETHEVNQGEFSIAKKSSYSDIVDGISTALRNRWLSMEQVNDVLNNSEIAGRQHVSLFRADSPLLKHIGQKLRDPSMLRTSSPKLSEFWTIPAKTYTRIIEDRSELLVLKIVTARRFWVDIDRVELEDYQKIERRREFERAALIVKLDLVKNTIQFRVPIKEHATNVDTPSATYAFILEMIQSQYGDEGLVWFRKLDVVDIGKAFPRIIKNHDDFCLHSDHPEDKNCRSTITIKAAPEERKDLRSQKVWEPFGKGFARSSIRGTWIWGKESEPIDVRMHYETIKTSPSTNRQNSRLYFAKPYTDEQVEHVIKRISDHS